MKIYEISGCGHFVIQENELSDGSLVYNVLIRDTNQESILIFSAKDQKAAEKTFKRISSIAWEAVYA